MSLVVHFSRSTDFDFRLHCGGFVDVTSLTSTFQLVAAGVATTVRAGGRSASVTLLNLQPLQTYTVVCLVTTLDGSQATNLTLAKRDGVTLTTACCKSVTAQLSTKVVFADRQLYSGGQLPFPKISLELSALPTSSVRLIPRVTVVGDTIALAGNQISITPAYRDVSSSDKALDASFALLPVNVSLAGRFSLSLWIVGPSATEYYNVTNFATFNVTKLSVDAIPAPSIAEAVFADNGLSVFVTFDSNTNLGGRSLSSSWPCRDFFNFSYASATSCRWINQTSLSFTLLRTSTLRPGDTIDLRSNVVRAACIVSNCQSLSNNSAQTVVVSGPRSPLVPSPAIAVSRIVNPCSSFVVDATSSYGAAGRSWERVVWNVSSNVGAAVTATQSLQTLLNTASSFQSTSNMITIPPNALYEGVTYTLTLTVTNFLSGTASTSASFFYGGAPSTPSVTILGAGERTLATSDVLSLIANASLSRCQSVANLSTSLNISWTVQQESSLVSLSSTSKNPRTFSLPKYSLSAGSTYVFTVYVSTAVAPRATAFASVRVYVSSSPIVAQLSGGDERSISNNTWLDASSSYDPDVASAQRSSLRYTWSCTLLTLSRFGEDCSATLRGHTNSSTVMVVYNTLTSGLRYQYSVQVTSLDGKKTSSASTVINKLNQTTISSTVSLSTDRSIINSGSNIQLTAAVQASSAVYGIWTAKQLGTSVSLQSAVTASNVSVAARAAVTGTALNFRMSSVSFTSSSAITFTFSLYASQTKALLSVSSMDVSVNFPPYGGTVSATPSTGAAFSTEFFASTVNWEDDSVSTYPLRYDFRFATSSSGPFMLLQDITVSSFASTALPSGLSQNDYQVWIVVRAYDYLQAFATAETTVVVTVPASFDAKSYLLSEIDRFTSSADNEAVVSTVSGIVSYISEVDCSATPNTVCSALNRAPCSTVANTCGKCLNGYTGVVGPSNAKCVAATAGTRRLEQSSTRRLDTTTLNPVGGACSIDADCLYNVCEAGVCVEPLQQCPGSVNASVCSGHGSCRYLVNGLESPHGACGIFDVYCTAKCSCTAGYGGSACEKTTAELLTAADVTAVVCDTLSSVLAVSDSSLSTLESFSSSLLLASRGLANTVNQSVCLPLLQSLSNLTYSTLPSATSYDLSDVMLESLSGLATTGTTSTDLDDSLSMIVQGIFTSMANGQSPVAYSDDKLQVAVRRDVVNTNVNSLIDFPSNEKETAYDVAVPQLELTATGAQVCASDGLYMSLSLTKWLENPYTTSTDDISSLWRMETPSDDTDHRYTPVAEAVYFYVSVPYATEQLFTVYSLEDRLANPTLNNTIPECVSLDLTRAEYSSCSSCHIVSYTNDSVRYACSDPSLLCSATVVESTSVRHRQLSSLSEHVKNFMVRREFANDVVVLQLVANLLATNFARAKAVLVVLAAIVVGFVVGVVLFRHWDAQHDILSRYARGSASTTATARVDEVSSKSAFFAVATKASSMFVKPTVASSVWITTATAAKSMMNSPRRMVDELLLTSLGKSLTRWQPKSWFEQLRHYHDIVAVLMSPAGSGRAKKWFRLSLKLLVMCFLNTLFFDVFFADQGFCEQHTTQEGCEEHRNVLLGTQYCVWQGYHDYVVSNGNVYTAVSRCFVHRPPRSLPFVASVAGVCLVASILLSMLLEYVLVEWCFDLPFGEDVKHARDLHVKSFHTSSTTPGAAGWKSMGMSKYQSMRRIVDAAASEEYTASQSLVPYLLALPAEKEPEFFLQSLKTHMDRVLAMGYRWVMPSADGVTRTYPVEVAQELQALEELVGVRLNGRVIPVSLVDALRGNSRFTQLRKALAKSRREAGGLREALKQLPSDRERDIALLRRFLMELLTEDQRSLLLLQEPSLATPWITTYSMRVTAWCAATSSLLVLLAFFVYWIVQWGTRSSGRTFSAWGLSLVVTVGTYYLCVETVRVFAVEYVAWKPIAKQVHALWVFMQARSTWQASPQKSPFSYSPFHLIQSLSAAGRVAHQRIAYPLMTGRVLRLLDAQSLHQLRSTVPKTTIETMVQVVVVIARLFGSFRAYMVQVLVALLTAVAAYVVVVGGYVLREHSRWFFFFTVAAGGLVLVLLRTYFILQNRRKATALAYDASGKLRSDFVVQTDASMWTRWASSSAHRSWTQIVTSAWRLYGHLFDQLLSVSSSEWRRRHSKATETSWRHRNMPQVLQGHIASPTPGRREGPTVIRIVRTLSTLSQQNVDTAMSPHHSPLIAQQQRQRPQSPLPEADTMTLGGHRGDEVFEVSSVDSEDIPDYNSVDESRKMMEEMGGGWVENGHHYHVQRTVTGDERVVMDEPHYRRLHRWLGLNGPYAAPNVTTQSVTRQWPQTLHRVPSSLLPPMPMTPPSSSHRVADDAWFRSPPQAITPPLPWQSPKSTLKLVRLYLDEDPFWRGSVRSIEPTIDLPSTPPVAHPSPSEVLRLAAPLTASAKSQPALTLAQRYHRALRYRLVHEACTDLRALIREAFAILYDDIEFEVAPPSAADVGSMPHFQTDRLSLRRMVPVHESVDVLRLILQRYTPRAHQHLSLATIQEIIASYRRHLLASDMSMEREVLLETVETWIMLKMDQLRTARDLVTDLPTSSYVSELSKKPHGGQRTGAVEQPWRRLTSAPSFSSLGLRRVDSRSLQASVSSSDDDDDNDDDDDGVHVLTHKNAGGVSDKDGSQRIAAPPSPSRRQEREHHRRIVQQWRERAGLTRPASLLAKSPRHTGAISPRSPAETPRAHPTTPRTPHVSKAHSDAAARAARAAAMARAALEASDDEEEPAAPAAPPSPREKRPPSFQSKRLSSLRL